MCGGVEIQLHAFLTLVLDGDGQILALAALPLGNVLPIPLV